MSLNNSNVIGNSKRPKNKRRTHETLFLERLKSISTDQKPAVANNLLRKKLGWEEDKYERIKNKLIDQGRVAKGKGSGGTLRLIVDGVSKPSAVKVFISYSHADEKLKDKLIQHISPLKKIGLISEWNDRKLNAGDSIDNVISQRLEEAEVVLLLVSIDFINSKYCYEKEMSRALELNSTDDCVVIPIILRACLWQLSPFAKLLALPIDGKAVSSFVDLDEAFTQVASGIKLAIEKLNAISPSPHS